MTTDKTTTIVAAAAGAAAGAAIYALASRRKPAPGAILPSTAAPPPVVYATPESLATCESLAVAGTMLLCTQNLAVSGANQVLLNLAEGHVWRGNVVLLSPSAGPFAKEFADLGVAVWIGDLNGVLERVGDVRIAICNTIMTAHLILALADAKIPSMWILHEWWPEDLLVEELTKRNDKQTTPEVVRKALKVCPRTVCVCKAQHELYKPANGAVTYVGVPEPTASWRLGPTPPKTNPGVTFLCLGIVCPRKNQHWAVEIFRKWAGDRQDVRLIVVGARYIRQYEIDYVEKVKASIGGDPRVELHEVTNDVDQYYRQSDALLFTSLNEVTPMVIAEAMMRGLPVVTTDIAGIPEMLTHGTHGFVLPPDEPKPFVDALQQLGAPGAEGQRRRLQMGAAAKKHAYESFTNATMVAQYRAAALALAPPVVLVDMDGCLVDWDGGFEAVWAKRTPIDRSKSYAMEECVPASHKEEARTIFHGEGFFRNLPAAKGGVEALHKLAAAGYRVLLCTSPVTTSAHCAGEKVEWVRANLGASWVPRVVITSDKTAVRGDVLIDDKPSIVGMHHPVWRQLLFDAPYNRHVTSKTRLASWDGRTLRAALDELLSSGTPPLAAAGAPPAGGGDEDAAALDEMSQLRSAVAALPDFSHLLPADYRTDYAAWRSGRPTGARGELGDAMRRMAEMRDSVLNNTSDEFTEVHTYRKGYASWRLGKASGAKSFSGAGAISQL